MKVRIRIRPIVFGLVCLSLTACSSSKQPPISQMALAQAAVEQATAAGAYGYAPLELKTSQDKINQAKAAIQAKDYMKAERLLEQAELDAKLAEAKSSTAKSQKAVDELQKSIDLLRETVQQKLPN